MNDNGKTLYGENKILAHEPVKGYRPVLIAFVAMGALYLAVILARTL